MNMNCQKHPKYKGKKYPKYNCAVCASIYFKFLSYKGPRLKPMASKVIKSKKIYSRKARKKDAGL